MSKEINILVGERILSDSIHGFYRCRKEIVAFIELNTS